MKTILIPIIFLLLNLCLSCSNRSGNRKSNSSEANVFKNNLYTVGKIVDGDTFWAHSGENNEIKIRLIGIDAPESKKVFKKEVGFYGKEAKAYLTDMIAGKKVILSFDIDTLDQYGRTLAYCFSEDGIFINQKMVEEGMAMIMTVVPNVKYQEDFYKAQVTARESRKGMWSK
jgi:micrococcal nuclease